MQEKVNPILSLPFPSSPELGAAIQVAEGVFWCRLPIPFELDHINVWLLDDGDGFTLVDTGINAGKTRGAWKALFSDIVKDLGINRVIVTHFHPDRQSGYAIEQARAITPVSKHRSVPAFCWIQAIRII